MPSLKSLVDVYKIKPDPNGSKKVISEPGRTSYAFIYEPRAMNEGDTPKFSVQMIFDKTNEKALKPLVQIAANAAATKWSIDASKWPKMKYNIMTMDTELDDGDLKNVEKHLLGKMTFNARNEKKPGVVGPNGKPLFDEDDFYSGCMARVSVNCYAYDNSGNKGVSFSLQNLMKVGDADRLDGKVAAEDEFANYAQAETAEEAGAETGF